MPHRPMPFSTPSSMRPDSTWENSPLGARHGASPQVGMNRASFWRYVYGAHVKRTDASKVSFLANVRIPAEERLAAESRIIMYRVASTHSLYYRTKRIVDIVLSGILLVAFIPVFLVIAALIKLDSPGHVLFTQQRVGSVRRSSSSELVWELRTFKLYKFRSMVKDADPVVHQVHIQAYVAGMLQVTADPITSFKLTTDPRITRVGKFIRRASLDELPQLFNVLKGEMSLVGPRPVPAYEVAAYGETQYERLAAKPGMTGLWQVAGRGTISFDGMIELDREYVRRQSLLLDANILLRTIPAVLTGRGTY